MTSFPACNKTSVSRKPCIADESTMDHYQENMVALSESVVKKVRAALPGEGLTMTLCPVGNKTSLSRKPCIADKNNHAW